jgi:hypothetical protein
LIAFAFGFAEQMGDVSQTRKNAPMPSKKAAKNFRYLKNSATNYSDCLSFIHFFFETRGTKKKFPKRNAEYKGYAPLTAPPFEKGGRKLFCRLSLCEQSARQIKIGSTESQMKTT